MPLLIVAYYQLYSHVHHHLNHLTRWQYVANNNATIPIIDHDVIKYVIYLSPTVVVHVLRIVECMLPRTLLLCCCCLGLVCSGEPTIWLRHNQSFMQPILSTVNQYEPTNMIYANISLLQRGWQPVAARGLLRRKIPWWWPNLLVKWVTALIFPGGRRGICMSKALSEKGGKQAYFTIQSDQVVKIKLRPI